MGETAGCADTMGGHDIAGLGRACADAGDTSACVAGGRINGNSHGTGTCEQGTAHGAVCCQRDTGVQQASECEGSTLEISCPDGEKIDILAVTYGRLSSEQCTEGRGAEDNVWSRTDCDSENDLDIVRGLCQRQQQCQVAATNAVFGDPCGGVFKYLEIDYKCAAKGVRHEPPAASAIEYVGCYNDSGDRRDLDGNGGSTHLVETGSAAALVECATACKSFAYMGLQWTGELSNVGVCKRSKAKRLLVPQTSAGAAMSTEAWGKLQRRTATPMGCSPMVTRTVAQTAMETVALIMRSTASVRSRSPAAMATAARRAGVSRCSGVQTSKC